MSKQDELGVAVAAAVRVAVANTAHTLTHPIHTVRTIFGFEQAKSIPELIRAEVENKKASEEAKASS